MSLRQLRELLDSLHLRISLDLKNLTLDKSLVRGFLSDEYNAGEIGSFYLSRCFEVGEKEKYEEIIANKITHRFFNNVEIKG